jgi:uncharacterized protein (DUF1810 family)
MTDEYDLGRFVTAQAEAYDDAIDILRRGAMCTPYMDFIFPRLGREDGDDSVYALSSLDEARAYLEIRAARRPLPRVCRDALPPRADERARGVRRCRCGEAACLAHPVCRGVRTRCCCDRC